MMSHKNIVSTIAGVTASVPKLSTKDVYLAYLPLAHVLELAGEVVELSNSTLNIPTFSSTYPLKLCWRELVSPTDELGRQILPATLATYQVRLLLCT